MSSLVLAMLLASKLECHPLIKHELRTRTAWCVQQRNKNECLKRVRSTARNWNCKWRER